MSYQFQLKGYPAAFTQKRDSKNYNLPKFTLTFIDKSGFKLFNLEIYFSEMTQVVDVSGKPIGLSAKGNSYESAEDYRKAVSWEITWSL